MADRIAVMPFDSILGVAAPAGGPGWAALTLATLALALAPLASKLRLPPIPWGWWVGIWGALSVACSAVYVHYYLQGGPRIIDATSYWLEARGLSSGLVSWPVEEPSASFRGRFLLHREGTDGSLHMGVIFPPGYPALLAVGFVLGAPLVVGPLLAGGLTVATALLARTLTSSAEVGRLAAVLCTLNACLRYHTADTMSHGLAALLMAGAVLLGLRAAHTDRWGLWVLSGSLAAWLAATRPASALALLLVGAPALLVWMIRTRRLTPLWCLAGAIVPLLLFALHQHALTGAWLVSSQQLYYLFADGPPGCFRYGFGAGIGCLAEHGDYVQSMAPDGYGLLAALGTTGRRVYLHLADLLNYAPFGVLLLAGIVAGARKRGTWIAAAVPLSLIAAYAPFYFDGCYPGGGARMLSDGLPFEIVLMAMGLAAWGGRFGDRTRGRRWALSAAIGLPALGFALHASHMHRMLRDRDAGRPMYEPAVVRETLGEHSRGLLFVDTDHAFNLAHDPAVRDPSSGLLVARARYDDRDALLWRRLGRPPAFSYVHRPWQDAPQKPRVEPWEPPAYEDVLVFEAEAEWPPLRQSGGYAVPTHLPDSCVSSGRALALVNVGQHEACVTTALPVPSDRVWARAWMVSEVVPDVRMWVEVGDRRIGLPMTAKELNAQPSIPHCVDARCCFASPEIRIDIGDEAAARWVVCSKSPWLALDRMEIRIAE